MKRKYKKVTGSVLGLILIAVIYLLNDLGYIKLEDTKDEENTNVDYELYNVVRVVDGDTIVVDFKGENKKVRLIGVDTPESVHQNSSKNTEEGKIASKYTKSKLENKKVGLEFDVQEEDKYGRLLAYVYIDGKMYNKILLKEGMAKIATYPPNVKYVEDFKKLQKEARENKTGFWDTEFFK